MPEDVEVVLVEKYAWEDSMSDRRKGKKKNLTGFMSNLLNKPKEGRRFGENQNYFLKLNNLLGEFYDFPFEKMSQFHWNLINF